ncbi:hypothetical protein TGAM01_v204778 [Trichoderma gamsii]|uniref:Uncharacterized protein n=1 Tax=Trichoderma gamsii TaxID=398673 RepID=A0A2P4ZPW5_9HYPO|nr:hypothetical protein TGAM01_v204778 [Trichoderma gamsii]PON26302.1 hypothetical protein TGAM01_v204778 [Trichoderma gamsii]
MARGADSRRRQRAGNTHSARARAGSAVLPVTVTVTVHIHRCAVAPVPAPRANDGTWTQRGGPARTALHLSPTKKLQCSAANPWKASMASHSTDWPPQRAWLLHRRAGLAAYLRCGGEIFGLQSFQPVWEQLRASKLAKLPQVHERLPPTRAAA